MYFDKFYQVQTIDGINYKKKLKIYFDLTLRMQYPMILVCSESFFVIDLSEIYTQMQIKLSILYDYYFTNLLNKNFTTYTAIFMYK